MAGVPGKKALQAGGQPVLRHSGTGGPPEHGGVSEGFTPCPPGGEVMRDEAGRGGGRCSWRV